MRRFVPILAVFIAVLFTVGSAALNPETAQAVRLREVGGYGLVTTNSSTFAWGSLDSEVNGTASAGEIVYINGWQIGVYHIGPNRWVAASAVRPIVDASGNPIANNVTRSGNQYYLNGNAITLPRRMATQAERFLANPGGLPVTYSGSFVASNEVTELVDTSRVWYSSRERVVSTMRVTGAYGFIYLRTAPRADAPRATTVANAHEIITAYEVVGDQWYRIGPNLWAPRVIDGETLLFPENVTAYAPAEYYNGGKWISVDLDRQQLTAWEGADVVMATRMKSGKYGWHTPAGVYQIYEKQPNARMSGNDYDLLDVAWTMYYTRSRVAIHTAYWHNNYNGRPGSHGCVNTPEEIARKLFHWAPVGTTVVNHNPYVFDQQDIADAGRWREYER